FKHLPGKSLAIFDPLMFEIGPTKIRLNRVAFEKDNAFHFVAIPQCNSVDLCVSVVKFSKDDPPRRRRDRTENHGEDKLLAFYNDTAYDEAPGRRTSVRSRASARAMLDCGLMDFQIRRAESEFEGDA